MNKAMKYLEKYKYLVALLSVFNFLLTPIHVAITGINPAHIVVLNYTLVILASSLIAANVKARIITYGLGLIVLLCIWLEYTMAENAVLEWTRLGASFLLFLNFCILLVRQLVKIKMVNLRFILGPLLGFLYLGIIGGILFEMMHLIDVNSFQLPENTSGYVFYYFSFISITTVGYGDVIPATQAARAVTMVLNIIGQFYLAIVIGVFIGKYINTKSE
jgi:voltage-gated potassium channel